MDADSSDSEIEEEIVNNDDETLLSEDKLPPEVLEAIVSLQIFEKVWSRTQLPAVNVLMILKEYEGSQMIFKKYVVYLLSNYSQRYKISFTPNVLSAADREPTHLRP